MFKGPIYANVRRFSRNECFVETNTLWKHLVQHAARVVGECYTDCLDITSDNIILGTPSKISLVLSIN
jgi:hypothetical protein